MNTINFFWTALAVESERTGVTINTDNCLVNNNSEEEFDKPIKRVSYLYKYGSFNIHFFSQCFSNFITEVPESLKIIDKICLTKNLNICSLSTGPGTYVIGFLYALHFLGKPLKGPVVHYKFINKHVAWRDVVCEMMDSVPLNAPKPESCKFIQCDVLTEIIPKAQNCIKIADVLFVCHTFSSTKDTDVIYHTSNDILQLLKPGALVFFMFNEDNSSKLKELTTLGRFLYGPTEITLKDMPYDKTIPTVLQVPIVDSGSSFFGVWQKSASVSLQKQSSTVKLVSVTPISESPETFNVIKNDTAQGISKLEGSIKVPNASTSDILTAAISGENVSPSSSTSFKKEPKLICSSNTENSVKKVSGGLPTKTISELKEFLKIANTTASNPEAISSGNISLSKKSDSASRSTEPKLNCSNNQANVTMNMHGLSTSTDSAISVQKNEPSKGNPTNQESSLNSLVKTLERLVTNLEEFVNSRNSVESPHNQQCCCPCSCRIQNMHHAESWGTRHNFNSCVRSRCHSHCVQDHHTCLNNSNYCNCTISQKDNFCQNVGNQAPRIVIPLQNTSETSLAQIFSLVSQINNSSI